VDRFGTEWLVYDRVRWAPKATSAEFRFVPPGHRDARSRLVVRSDCVPFELRSDDPAWAMFSPTDLSDRTLNFQLYVARRAGPLDIPATSGTTLVLEMRRLARDFPRGVMGAYGRLSERPGTPHAECGSRHVAAHARPSRLGFRAVSPCDPYAVREVLTADAVAAQPAAAISGGGAYRTHVR
jgi:hypothetical protein